MKGLKILEIKFGKIGTFGKSKDFITILNMSQSQPKAEYRLKENIDYLCDFLYELCEESIAQGNMAVDISLIGLACSYVKNYNAISITEDFIFHSVRYWNEIHSKSVTFFETHMAKVFGGLPLSKDQLDMFKILYTDKNKNGESYVSEEDIELVWDYLHACCKIAINYMHDNQDSYQMIKVKLGASKNPYTLNLEELAKKWNIKL